MTDTQRFYEEEPKDTGRFVIQHYPEGSVIYPEGSDQSIFKIVNGTPCVEGSGSVSEKAHCHKGKEC